MRNVRFIPETNGFLVSMNESLEVYFSLLARYHAVRQSSSMSQGALDIETLTLLLNKQKSLLVDREDELLILVID